VGSYVTEAIVIGVRRYGEADRLVTLFTRDRGRLTCIAKSARKPTSRLRGISEPFVRSKMELAEGKTLDILRQAEVIDAHLGLRGSWSRLQLAGHVAEIATKLSDEKVPDEVLFELLGEVLDSISNDRRNAVIRFKARLLEHMGVYPDLSCCVRCGSEKVKGDVHLDSSYHGFICAECAKETGTWRPVPMSVLYLLHELQNGNDPGEQDTDKFEMVDDILTNLLQQFIQAGFKTASAARHARKAGLCDNKKASEDETKTGPDAEPI